MILLSDNKMTSPSRLRKIIVVRISFFCILFFLSSPIYSQNNLGILVGPSAATMSGSYIKGSSGLEWGFAAFINIDKEFGDRWSFVTGINVIQKGGKKLMLAIHGDSTYGYQSMYLQLPLLIRAKFPFASGKWYVAPYSGFFIGGNLSMAWKPGEQFEFEEEGADENSPGGKPKKLEMGIPIGLHIWRQFPGGSRFMFDLHYELGLANVFQEAQDAGLKAKNNVICAMFGFSVPLQ